MYDFLTRFKLSTRVCTAFALLGGFAVLLSFGGMFAVGEVHREYMVANNTIESVRRLSALETSLFSLNRSLFFFSDKAGAAGGRNVHDALADYEQKLSEITPYLESEAVKKKYVAPLAASVVKYRADTEEMFVLRDRSAEAAEKAQKAAAQASKRLEEMIEEATLPSATFALNALQEQLDEALQVFDAALSEKSEAERQKRINEKLETLKQAMNAAKQAEMVNSAQLKTVLALLGNMEDDIRRKMKSDKELEGKIAEVSRTGSKNAALLKELIDTLVMNSAHMMSDAETFKLLFQKLFVAAAAVAGILTFALAFLSLWGIRYPLSRLIENMQEIARGDRSVYIHFTERGDEIGTLAQALAALQSNLKYSEAADGTLNAGTYGSVAAYVPLGSPVAPAVSEDGAVSDENAEGLATSATSFNEDAARMQKMLKHIRTVAQTVSRKTGGRFDICRRHLDSLADALAQVIQEIQILYEKTQESLPHDFSALSDRATETMRLYRESYAALSQRAEKESEASGNVLKQAEKIKLFSSGLINWARMMSELSDSIQKIASQTKILALNASIEAVKSGEKAKAFGNAAVEIRSQAQQTVSAAEQLLTNLGDMRNETYAFVQTVEDTVGSIQSMHSLSADIVALFSKQRDHFGEESDLMGNITTQITAAAECRAVFEPMLTTVSKTAQEASSLVSDITVNTDAVQQAVSEFVSELASGTKQMR